MIEPNGIDPNGCDPPDELIHRISERRRLVLFRATPPESRGTEWCLAEFLGTDAVSTAWFDTFETAFCQFCSQIHSAHEESDHSAGVVRN